MDSRVPVLIVGAGPVGLMMACELARRGISFRIIDKKPERTLSSNATWIQTRTIELLDQIGIADRFLDISHRCDAINVYINGKQLTKLSLKHLDSPYPFILMLPQSETERLLNDYLEELHVKVERSVELIDIKSDDMATATLRHPDNRTENVTCDWIIACDGANSIIRGKCGFHFPGEDLTEQFVVADAKIDFSFMPKDEIHLFFDPGTLFAAFPMGKNKYRIAANLHLGYPRKIFTEREVIEIVQERAHGNYYVTDVAWISPFWIHSKYVEQMRHGPIFLAGDAAHIHSPAGGQGMNTGLQDVYNLAWKLALVIQGKAAPSLLDSYQSERHPIIKEVVTKNEYFTKMALFDKTFLTKLRKFSHELAHDEANLSKEIGRWLTQLDIRYQNSSVIDYETTVSTASPQPGERAPDVMINSSTQLYHYFQNTQHNILLFAGAPIAKNELEKIKELSKQLNQAYTHLIKIHFIATEKLTDVDNLILDENGVIHQYYHVQNPAIFIVRPDGYIAYCSTELIFSPIEKFFERYLHP